MVIVGGDTTTEEAATAEPAAEEGKRDTIACITTKLYSPTAASLQGAGVGSTALSVNYSLSENFLIDTKCSPQSTKFVAEISFGAIWVQN